MVALISPRGSPFQPRGLAASAADRASVARQGAAHDAELVRCFTAGDEDAFAEIVTRHRAKMHAIAFQHLRNHADAEEIAQDTFILAHRGLARFRGESSLATWLYRIACNLSHNRYKYYLCRRRYVTLSLDGAISADHHASVSDSIASEAPSAAREAAVREFSEIVIACMARLGPIHHEVLRRRNGLNESYGDIAQGLGIGIGTVKSRIGRARQDLRALVAQAYPELAPDASSLDWFEPIRRWGGHAVANGQSPA